VTINRWAARVDANKAAIVAALRAAGATVYDLRRPVDILCGYRGQTVLIEIKVLTGKRAPKAAAYTEGQSTFLRTWKGGPVATVTDPEGALRAIGALPFAPPQS
jgi:Holliday junction resolvase